MINGLNPIDSLFSTSGLGPASSPFGSPVDFGTTLDQALIQAKTPADKAKVEVLQAKLSEQNALAGIFSDSTSVLGLGAEDMFGVGSPLGLPSWASDVQRLLGANSDVSQLFGLSQQAAFLAQSSFNQSLSSLGGGGFDSLF